MHITDHDHRDGDPHPKVTHAREAARENAVFGAAAAQRPDVLGPAGLLHMQRSVGNAGTASLVEESQAEDRSPVLDAVGSGGRALDDDVRAEMEARLGADFSDVRVHTDSSASDSARAVGAHAYTVGTDLVFQHGRYNPSSDEGKLVLAHELTHVIQQRDGPVEGTSTGDGISVSDPGDRFERAATENAERAMSAPQPATSAVQREITDEDEDLQALRDPAVQRETAEDEEELQNARVGTS